MIRWFADLPIERKLRVVILVPAIAVFTVAMIVHVGMNLLHLRDDLQWSAARIARVTGAGTLDALRMGDDKAALKAMSELRDEWLVSDAELLAANGQRLAVYRREHNEVHLEPAAAANSGAALPSGVPDGEPEPPRLYLQAGQLHIMAAVQRNRQILGFVHVRVPLQTLYQDWRGYLLITLAAIFAAVLTAYWLAARLQQQISGPIVNLAHTMQRVSAEEDYSLRVERSSQDEIGSLIDGFNQMLGQIRHRDSRLEKYRQFLEQQVAERTDNLGNANRELQARHRRGHPRQGGRGTRQQRQERIPGAHEPRNPHADERRHGHVGTAAGDRTDAAAAASVAKPFPIPPKHCCRSSTTSWISRRSRPASSSWSASNSALRETVEQTIEIFAARAHAKGLELACAIDLDVPGTVRSDPMRLRQVLINLVGNAIKFTESGEVIVRVKAVGDNELLRFEVDRHRHRHFGGGADAHLQCLQPGRLVHHAQVRRHRLGTGHLPATGDADGRRDRRATARSTVARHSGSMCGSSRWPTPSPTLTRLPRMNLVGLRALIVDDNASNREILQQHLQSWGVEVVAVDTSAAALADTRRRRGRAIRPGAAGRSDAGHGRH